MSPEGRASKPKRWLFGWGGRRCGPPRGTSSRRGVRWGWPGVWTKAGGKAARGNGRPGTAGRLGPPCPTSGTPLLLPPPRNAFPPKRRRRRGSPFRGHPLVARDWRSCGRRRSARGSPELGKSGATRAARPLPHSPAPPGQAWTQPGAYRAPAQPGNVLPRPAPRRPAGSQSEGTQRGPVACRPALLPSSSQSAGAQHVGGGDPREAASAWSVPLRVPATAAGGSARQDFSLAGLLFPPALWRGGGGPSRRRPRPR